MGTKELQDLGLDPDAIRIKLDQIMEWNDLNINPTTISSLLMGCVKTTCINHKHGQQNVKKRG